MRYAHYLLLFCLTCCSFSGDKKAAMVSSSTVAIEEATALEKAGEYRRALVIWQKLQKQELENPLYLYHIGWNYGQVREYAKAERYLKESLRYDSYNKESLVALAYVYLQTEHYTESKQLFQTTLARFPGFLPAEKGKELAERGEQLVVDKQAEEERQKQTLQEMDQAESLEQEQKFPEALAVWQNLCLADPGNSKYPYRIGRIYLKMQDYEKAKGFFAIAISIDANHIDAKLALAETYLLTGELEGAKEIYEGILLQFPAHREAKEGVANVQKKLRMQKEAIKLQESKNLSLMAEKLSLDGRENEALCLWLSLSDADPENSYYLYRIGQIYVKKADEVKAEKYLVKSVKIAPDSAPAWLQLGELYLLTQRKDLAQDAFNQVLKIDPTNIRAKIDLQHAQ